MRQLATTPLTSGHPAGTRQRSCIYRNTSVDDTVNNTSGEDIVNNTSVEDIVNNTPGEVIVNNTSGEDIVNNTSGEDIVNNTSGEVIVNNTAAVHADGPFSKLRARRTFPRPDSGTCRCCVCKLDTELSTSLETSLKTDGTQIRKSAAAGMLTDVCCFADLIFLK